MSKEEKTNEDLFNVDLNMLEEMSTFISAREAEEDDENDQRDDQQQDNINSNVEIDEEEEKDTKDNNKEDTSSQDTKPDSSRLTPYFKLLVEEGVFDVDDETQWDGTAEGIVNLQHAKLNAWKEQYKSEVLSPRMKWLQDNLEEGVPLEELLAIDRQEVSLDTIKETDLSENTNLQKEIARQYYKETTRFSDERIEREIERLDASGDLKTESPAFYKELKSIVEEKKTQALENARLERENEVKRQKETLDNFKSSLTKTEEIIPGLKITNVMRDKIFSALTEVVDVDKDTGMPMSRISKARAENPMEFEMKVAYLFELTNGFKDWGPLTISGKKQAIRNFEEAAANIDKRDSASRQNLRNSPSSGDFLDELEKMHRKGLI